VPEFRIVCNAARNAGLEALHGTLDEVEYDGSLLRLQGEPVHLVYRRALLEECPEGDLVAAARDRSAAIVNPFRARVANNKKLFALLQDPRFAHLVEEKERRVIDETIPWTRVLRDGRASYGEWVVDLLPFVSDNRERLVLKPASDYGGHGVSLGMETEQAVWDRLIEDHVEEGDFVVQEYVPVPEEMFPTVEDGHVQMRLKRFNINPFGIGGRYAGMITRISDQAVINVSAGGGLLPSVVGRHRQRLLAEEESTDDEAAGLRR
jgi:Glutathionylspermidine synthase preATP-grasp